MWNVNGAVWDALRTAKRLQKIIALLFGDWFLESLEHLQHVFPDFSFF